MCLFFGRKPWVSLTGKQNTGYYFKGILRGQKSGFDIRALLESESLFKKIKCWEKQQCKTPRSLTEKISNSPLSSFLICSAAATALCGPFRSSGFDRKAVKLKITFFKKITLKIIHSHKSLGQPAKRSRKAKRENLPPSALIKWILRNSRTVNFSNFSTW